MSSPFTALIWEIWRRNRGALWPVLAAFLFAVLTNVLFHTVIPSTDSARGMIGAINGILLAVSLMFVFGVFNFTESNSAREWTGFPYRLFTLPASTLLLVAAPISLGVICVELLFAAWANFVFTHGEIAEPIWFGVLIGAFMIVYQTGVWTLAAFRISRILCLGFAGLLFVLIGCLPFLKDVAPAWFSKELLTAVLCAIACGSFGFAWFSVARQRSGGRRRQNRLAIFLDRVIDLMPRRSKGFRSPTEAHFWFEWRRSGMLLPFCIATLLLLCVLPLSWYFRNDSNGTLWILGWTLAAPLILGAPVGKGFSKLDIWSRGLSLPAMIAVRPLATNALVAIKLKVAARSAAIAWLIVLVFLALWLPLWANLDGLALIRVGFWMAYGHAVHPQYAIAALILIGGILLTWKFLVDGLWIGLSGNLKLFIASAAIYCVVPLLAMLGLAQVLNHKAAVRAWIREDPNQLLALIEWIAALGVIAKFWISARAWRGFEPRRVWQYVLFWCAGAVSLVALALLLWADGLLNLSLMALLGFPPLDPLRLRNLMLLLALLAIPFARIGLAPASLAKNRHEGQPASQRKFLNKPIAILATILSIGALFLAASGQAFDRVNLGGPVLRMFKTGEAGPTIVFEAGAGGPLESWVRVQSDVSKFARTISYDRAGNGLSTKGPAPRDGLRIANELHAALQNAQASPPYILVGHSLGGPYIRVFAGLYSEEVAGLILVDPTQEDLIAWAKARDANTSKKHKPSADNEVDCAPATFLQAQEHPVPAHIPVFLITGIGPRVHPAFLPKEMKAEVERDQKSVYPEKLKFHKNWVDQFPRGQLIITANSGHGIPFEEPELVVRIIQQMVSQVSARAREASR